MISNIHHALKNLKSTDRSYDIPAEKRVDVGHGQIKMGRSVTEFSWSVLIGFGGFLLFFGCGYWLFADPNPGNGRIGGLILGPFMDVLFFVFAWGYFGQRQKWQK